MHQPDPATRRTFLKVLATGTTLSWGAAAAYVPRVSYGQVDDPAASIPLALASYTLRNFDLDQTLLISRQVGLSGVCLKSMHLPLESSDDDIQAAVSKVQQAELQLYGGGVIYMKNETDVEQAFKYGQSAGMVRLVIGPTPELLPLISRKVTEYDLQVAIHNHGPGDRHFPTPREAYRQIKDLDPRVGICHDVGHTVRYGADPIAITKECADRIYDVHIKDVNKATKEGHCVPCGRGVIDLPALLRTLNETGYAGYLAFEYESEPKNPLPGLAESVGYVRGVLDSI